MSYDIENMTPEERAAEAQKIIESPKVQKTIREITEVVRPEVARIEGSPELCEHHYDQYLSLLSQFNTSRLNLFIVANALKNAGGNRAGIAGALYILVAK